MRGTSTDLVETVPGVRKEVEVAIRESVHNCLTDVELGLAARKKGKVRDTYIMSDKIVLVTTDRQSAFDRHLASVPFKGQVLNQTSAWWFKNTQHIVQNALLAVPDPNVSIMKKCSVFPVEFVVRGFMTGSTSTSLWTHYSKGAREYCGNSFPDGMRKNDRLAVNVITPTTKADDHDEPISSKQIVSRGLMTQDEWDQVSSAALSLFNFGQAEAAKRDLLLVDTKYEFGKDTAGNIFLIDEIHTPDSSRYWLTGSYEARHAKGQEPESIDKEFLRLWFKERCDPYKDEVLPAAPEALIVELSRRYVLLYERITGESFQPAVSSLTPKERMLKSLAPWL